MTLFFHSYSSFLKSEFKTSFNNNDYIVHIDFSAAGTKSNEKISVCYVHKDSVWLFNISLQSTLLSLSTAHSSTYHSLKLHILFKDSELMLFLLPFIYGTSFPTFYITLFLPSRFRSVAKTMNTVLNYIVSFLSCLCMENDFFPKDIYH